MILLYIHLAIFVIDMVLFVLSMLSIKHKFIDRYPDRRMAKSHWTAGLLDFIKIAVVALCPLINIAIAWVLIFNGEDLTEKTLRKLYKDSVAKEEDEK